MHYRVFTREDKVNDPALNRETAKALSSANPYQR